MDHTGKVILITGAARGIGRGIALRLAEDGADLVVSDIDEDNLQKTCADIKAKDRECIPVLADVSNKDQVEKIFTQAVDAFGKIDVSIHVAGAITVGLLVDIPEKDWNRVVDVNAKGVFLCCQSAARQMLEQNYGKIINCASDAGKTGAVYESHYAASKWAVIGITQSLAKELAPHGITVNAFCPGVIKTDLWTYLDKEEGKLEGLKPGERYKQIAEAIPLGRVGQPSDIAGLVTFLASKDADYITGQSISVNGGLLMS